MPRHGGNFNGGGPGGPTHFHGGGPGGPGGFHGGGPGGPGGFHGGGPRRPARFHINGYRHFGPPRPPRRRYPGGCLGCFTMLLIITAIVGLFISFIF